MEVQNQELNGFPAVDEEELKRMKIREDHKLMMERHKGHESMHIEMMFIFLVMLFIAQIVLFEWKRRHYRSYQMVTLVALWIIPVGIAFRNEFWRFIVIWIIFSLITLIVVRKATERPLQGSTPRLVYKWFYLIYKASYILGIIGYIIMMAAVLGVNLIFGSKAPVWIDSALNFLFYGLYYGVMGQDVSEFCADKMASQIGYYTREGMPTRYLEQNVCAVCGNQLFVPPGEEGIIENTYQLSCHHTFHEFCIRGWCIVGKKQICPYCKEKVDLKRMFPNPWEKPHVLYGQLLDWIRWMLTWQPIILMLFQAVSYVLGLK